MVVVLLAGVAMIGPAMVALMIVGLLQTVRSRRHRERRRAERTEQAPVTVSGKCMRTALAPTTRLPSAAFARVGLTAQKKRPDGAVSHMRLPIRIRPPWCRMNIALVPQKLRRSDRPPLTDATHGRPVVSAIVPCYSYGRFLPGCLDSILAQEGVDVRVLVIDDCSTDGSAAIARAAAKRDERVEFRAHSQNAGLVATVNEGLEWASGEYILVLSSDDLLVPGALARASTVMARHPNVGMVYGRPLQAPETRSLPQATGGWRNTRIWPGREWLRERCRSAHNGIASPTVVVRSSVHRAAGSYDPDLPHTCDLNMWLRVAAHADVAYIRGVPQAIYRTHSSNMSRGLEPPLVDLAERRKAFDSLFATCGARLDEPQRLQAMTGRALARQALWQASRAVDRGGAPELVDDLVAFAFAAWPEATRLHEWRGLELRRRIGAGRSLIFFPFIATGAFHRLRYRARIARLRLRGT